jgi:hypothetical protein
MTRPATLIRDTTSGTMSYKEAQSSCFIAIWSAVSLPSIHFCPGTHIGWTLLRTASMSGSPRQAVYCPRMKLLLRTVATHLPPVSSFFVISILLVAQECSKQQNYKL